MANLRTIQYALHRGDGLVVSRVGGEVAWPVMNYEKVGEGGDYRKPIEYDLERLSVQQITSDWGLLVWTKYVPTEIKNKHRAFWGMRPLPVEPLPRTIAELCERHHVCIYFVHRDGEVGVVHSNWASVKMYHWFKKTRRGFIQTDLTDHVDDKHKQAVRRKVNFHDRRLTVTR